MQSLLGDLEKRMGSVDLVGCSEAELAALVGDLHRGRRCLDGYLAQVATEACAREAAGSGGAPEALFRGRGQVSRAEAGRQAGRGRVGDRFPGTAARLQAGEALSANVDTLTRLTGFLRETEQARLAVLDPEIADRAVGLPPEIFARWLRRQIRSITTTNDDDDDGGGLLSGGERQRAAARVSMGRRDRTGMWWISGELDPERGAELNAAINALARALAGDQTPTANTRADALHRLTLTGADTLTTGSTGSPGDTNHRNHRRANRSDRRGGDPDPSPGRGRRDRRASSEGDHARRSDRGEWPGGEWSGGEWSGGGWSGGEWSSGWSGGGGVLRAGLGIGYIIDAHTLAHGPHSATVAQTWGGDDHDPRAVQRLACNGDWWAIHLDHHGHPDTVGPTRRTATRHQRLALRALYRECPLDGSPFDHCDIHHVNTAHHHGGTTTLDNLIPLSTHWHHRIHDQGWTLTMHPDRSLDLHRPNGQHDRHIPPPTPITRQHE